MTAPLIVTAEFVPADFAMLDGQRRAHFPPERNLVSAHLTLFHALPPSIESELKHRLAAAADCPRPAANLVGLRNLGRGVAYVLASAELESIRAELAEAFAGCLTAQDAKGWWPHVTVQNKVEPPVARSLLRTLEQQFRPRPLGIAGLALHRYRDGPWGFVQRWTFRGLSSNRRCRSS